MNNNQLIQVLQNILEALMTISVKGTDTITMSNVLQAVQQTIDTQRTVAAQTGQAPESKMDFIPDTEE